MEKIQSKIQKGIQEGKSKIQTSQEIMSLKDKVRENQEKRTSLILPLGELTYEKVRNNQLKDEIFNPIAEEILKLDKNIFNLLKTIEEKTKEERYLTCECGNILSTEDKFCKNCGKKVESITSEDDGERILCSRCGTEIPVTSKYCSCCGIKID